MKKILFSLLTITAIVTIAVGSSLAVFSDKKQILGSSIATGTLKLTLNKSTGKPFAIENAYPGYWSGWEYMDIYNSGTLPFEAYLTLSKASGSDLLYDYVVITLETSGGDSICHNSDGNEHVIYDGLMKDFPAQSLVSSANYWHLANENDGSGSPADNIRAGYSERVCQRVGVHSSADNSIMGLTVTFDETVDAMQDND